MAVKKTDTETAAMVLDAPGDPWKEEEEILLPKAARGEDNYLIASVNGRVYKILRGKKVKVPAPIAEVVRNSEAMRDEADAYIGEQTEKHEKKDL
jgi:hypothetical protein